MFGLKLKKLERRVTELECAVSCGHKFIFKSRYRPTLFGVLIRPEECQFVFECLLCGHIEYKTREQLSGIEVAYLRAAGILSSKRRRRPKGGTGQSNKRKG